MSPKAIKKDNQLDNELLRKGSFRLMVLCLFIYSTSYIGRLNFSACMADIVRDLSLDKTFTGAISTGYLASYGTGQFINGLLGDKISPKYMIFMGAFCAGTANIIMGFGQSHIHMLIFWCINGYFQSMLWPSIIRSFSEWLPKEKHSTAAMFITPAIPVGTMLSYGLSSIFLKHSNFRFVFFVSGGIIIFASFIWLLGIISINNFIKSVLSSKANIDSNKQNSDDSNESSLQDKQNVGLIKLIIKTGLTFSVIGILFNGILKDGVTQWVPTFISEFFNVDVSSASAFSMILPIINISGPYLAIFIDKKLFKNEMKVSALMFLISIVSIAMLYFIGSFNVLISVILIAICTSSMLGANTMFLTFMPFHFSNIGKSASVTGFLNSCAYLSSALSSITIGYIAETRGWSITILSWLTVAILGFVVCILGIRVWSRGRKVFADA